MPPAQDLAQVQLVRGGADLIYGPGPGAAINLLTRRPRPRAPFSLTSVQVGGSDGLFSSYNAMEGTDGAWEFRASAAGATRDMLTLATLSQSSHTLAAALLADVEQRLADLPALMLAFQREPLVVSQALCRIDWVMDGWDRICALWQEATSRQPIPNRLALLEMASQAPKLPTEALSWGMPGVTPPPDLRGAEGAASADAAGGFIDWNSQVTLADLVARNERVVATLVKAA